MPTKKKQNPKTNQIHFNATVKKKLTIFRTLNKGRNSQNIYINQTVEHMEESKYKATDFVCGCVNEKHTAKKKKRNYNREYTHNWYCYLARAIRRSAFCPNGENKRRGFGPNESSTNVIFISYMCK